MFYFINAKLLIIFYSTTTPLTHELVLSANSTTAPSTPALSTISSKRPPVPEQLESPITQTSIHSQAGVALVEESCGVVDIVQSSPGRVEGVNSKSNAGFEAPRRPQVHILGILGAVGPLEVRETGWMVSDFAAWAFLMSHMEGVF